MMYHDDADDTSAFSDDSIRAHAHAAAVDDLDRSSAYLQDGDEDDDDEDEDDEGGEEDSHDAALAAAAAEIDMDAPRAKRHKH